MITNRVIALSSGSTGSVTFSLNSDGIAQEHNETLILELVPTTALPTGYTVFFRKYLSLTIVDSDCMLTKVLIAILRIKKIHSNSRFNFIY